MPWAWKRPSLQVAWPSKALEWIAPWPPPAWLSKWAANRTVDPAGPESPIEPASSTPSKLAFWPPRGPGRNEALKSSGPR